MNAPTLKEPRLTTRDLYTLFFLVIRQGAPVGEGTPNLSGLVCRDMFSVNMLIETIGCEVTHGLHIVDAHENSWLKMRSLMSRAMM